MPKRGRRLDHSQLAAYLPVEGDTAMAAQRSVLSQSVLSLRGMLGDHWTTPTTSSSSSAAAHDATSCGANRTAIKSSHRRKRSRRCVDTSPKRKRGGATQRSALASPSLALRASVATVNRCRSTQTGQAGRETHGVRLRKRVSLCFGQVRSAGRPQESQERTVNPISQRRSGQARDFRRPSGGPGRAAVQVLDRKRRRGLKRGCG